MAQVEIWLPILTDANGFRRPNVPTGINHCQDDSMVLDFQTGSLANTFALVAVDEKDVDKCTRRVADKDVPEADKLLVNMIRECREDWDTKAPIYFGTNPHADKAHLVHAIHRGLSPKLAEGIRIKSKLPSTLLKDGIDIDIHKAAVVYARRALNVSEEEAERIIKEEVSELGGQIPK